MKIRRLIIAILCFSILLLSYLLLQKKESIEIGTESTQAQLLSLNKGESLKNFEVVLPDDQYALGQSEGRWTLISPVEDAGNAKAIEVLVTSLTLESRLDEIEVDISRLGEFGLAEPMGYLEIKTDKGHNYVLDFGDELPTAYKNYVKWRHENKVLVVSRGFVDAFKVTPNDLRDKRVFSIARDQLTQFSIQNEVGEYTFEKELDAWFQTSPEGGKVKREKAQELFSKFTALQVTGFYDTELAPLDQNALSAPVATVRVSDGEKEETLAFGRLDDEKGWLVSGGVRSTPFYVNVALPTDALDLIDRAIFEFHPDDVVEWSYDYRGTELKATFKEGKWVLEGEMKTPFSFEKNLKRWINLISALNYVTQEPLAEYTIAGRKPVQIDLTLNDGQVISVSWFLSRSEPVLVVGERVYHLSATDEQLLEQGLDVLLPAGVGSVKK